MSDNNCSMSPSARVETFVELCAVVCRMLTLAFRALAAASGVVTLDNAGPKAVLAPEVLAPEALAPEALGVTLAGAGVETGVGVTLAGVVALGVTLASTVSAAWAVLVAAFAIAGVLFRQLQGASC